MKINITPNLDQIRFIAKSAMHAWDHQSLEDGRDQVVADMQELLAYLGAFDDSEGVVVASVARIKAGVRIERSTSDGDFFDLTDRFINQNISLHVDQCDCEDGSSTMRKQGVRSSGSASSPDQENDFGASVDGTAKR